MISHNSIYVVKHLHMDDVATTFTNFHIFFDYRNTMIPNYNENNENDEMGCK